VTGEGNCSEAGRILPAIEAAPVVDIGCWNNEKFRQRFTTPFT
jgi:hypothetical protein